MKCRTFGRWMDFARRALVAEVASSFRFLLPYLQILPFDPSQKRLFFDVPGDVDY